MANDITILLDVDGVLANFAAAFCEALYKTCGVSKHEHHVTDFNFQSIGTPDQLNKCWSHIRRSSGLVERLAEYPDAMGALAELRALGRVVAVTSPLDDAPYWMHERTKWLKARGFDRRDIVFTADKTLVDGTFLVDDCREHVEQATLAVGLLVKRPWASEGQTLGEIVETIRGW